MDQPDASSRPDDTADLLADLLADLAVTDDRPLPDLFTGAVDADGDLVTAVY